MQPGGGQQAIDGGSADIDTQPATPKTLFR